MICFIKYQCNLTKLTAFIAKVIEAATFYSLSIWHCVHIVTYKEERCLSRKHVIYSIFKNQMHEVINVL